MTIENTNAQQALPIRIAADGKFSNSINPLLNKLEMWINFQALKANWYGEEDLILCFDFTLIRTLEEKVQYLTAQNWTIKHGVAYHFESSLLTTIAFIEIDDLLQHHGIEQAIKGRLTKVVNTIAQQHGLRPLPMS